MSKRARGSRAKEYDLEPEHCKFGRLAVEKAKKDIKTYSIEELFKCKILDREFNILPFLANALTYYNDRYTEVDSLWNCKVFSYKELNDLAESDLMLAGDNDSYTLGEILVGAYNRTIPKELLYMLYRKNPSQLYVNISNIVCRELFMARTAGGSQQLILSEGIENSAALSYYITAKWAKDRGIIPKLVGSITSLDKIIAGLLDVSTNWSRFFKKEIDAEELKTLMCKSIDADDVWLSLRDKEILESNGVDTEKIGKLKVSHVLAPKDAVDWDSTERSVEDETFVICALRKLAEVISNEGSLSAQSIKREMMSYDTTLANVASMEEDYHEYKVENTEQKEQVFEMLEKVKELEKCLAKVESIKGASVKKAEQLEAERLEEKKNRDEQVAKEVAKEVGKIKLEYASALERIEELKNDKVKADVKYNDLDNKYKGVKKEHKSLKSSLSKLAVENTELTCTLSDIEYEKSQLENVDWEVPFDMVLGKIKDKKIMVVGGKRDLCGNLKSIGLNSVCHIEADNKMSSVEFGDYDILVMVTRYVSHKTTIKAKADAEKKRAKIVNFNGTNLESMCRVIATEGL